MPDLTTVFGLLALIFLVSALTSKLVERAPISFPLIFLGLGFVLGPLGLGLIKVGLHDPVLETVATISLSFVLFLDALTLPLDEIRKNFAVPLLSLGPGALGTLLLVALAAALLLHFSPVQALLIGAVLSSVDPVLLRDVVRDERIPRSIRESLRFEAGANDILVLPILLVLMAVALGQGSSSGGWLVFLFDLFILGPVAGFLIGALSSKLIDWVRSLMPINREYRALFGIGVLMASYFTGERLGGSGFLAVFAAGLATAIFDDDLCDCFLEYGEITSEMAMLLAFMLFGSVLSSLISPLLLVPELLFALVVLGVARPAVISLVLRKTRVSRLARLFIGWFGPRGLSSLLFGLLLVSAGVPGSEQIMAAAGVVVIISVILHGVSAAPLAIYYSSALDRQTYPEERIGTFDELFDENGDTTPRISVEALADELNSSRPPLILDVRSRSTYGRDAGQIPGSLRVLPDQVAEWAATLPKPQELDRSIVAYCT